MDDTQAALHQEKQGEQGLRRFIKSHIRNTKVDSSKLSEGDRVRHERTLYKHGRYASALSQARKEVRLKPYKSQKPPLGEGEK
jgi:hypothetical protein